MICETRLPRLRRGSAPQGSPIRRWLMIWHRSKIKWPFWKNTYQLKSVRISWWRLPSWILILWRCWSLSMTTYQKLWERNCSRVLDFSVIDWLRVDKDFVFCGHLYLNYDIFNQYVKNIIINNIFFEIFYHIQIYTTYAWKYIQVHITTPHPPYQKSNPSIWGYTNPLLSFQSFKVSSFQLDLNFSYFTLQS